MLGGNGIGRLYFDPSVPPQARSALESVLQGKQGGVWEVIGSLVPQWRASVEAPIQINSDGETTRLTIGNYGELASQPLKGANGQPTRLLNGSAAFRESITLARGTGSSWRDPEMREWQSGGHSEEAEFDWSA
jgi:hypothetical protein